MTKKIVNIIGAGPVGNYLAHLLADKFEVNVYEEHKEIGKPVQCAGILTHSIKEIIELPKEIIQNEIKEYEINYKNKKINFALKNPDLIVDRAKLDTHLYNIAKEKGVKFHLGWKLLEINDTELVFEKEGDKIKRKKEILVGADGPNSIVSKSIGNKNESWMGIQARIKMKSENIKVFMEHGKFAWIIPESKGICRAGIMDEKDTSRETFNQFIKGKEIIDMQAGLIPKYDAKTKHSNTNVKGNTYIIGDAASMVKATTGGGIVPGMRAAKVLAKCLIDNKNYDQELKLLKEELKAHSIIREILDKLKEKEKEKLFEIIIKYDLLNNIDRDETKKSEKEIKKRKNKINAIEKIRVLNIITKIILTNPRIIINAPKIYKWISFL